MGNNPVNQAIIRPTPVIVNSDADVGFGKVRREGMAIDKQRTRRQCLNQPLPMFMETIESELLLPI